MASALDGFADKVCDPAFSPDGKHLAFAGNVTGFYPVEYTQGDLDVIEGRRQELAGRLQQRYGYAKDQIHKDVDDWFKTLK